MVSRPRAPTWRGTTAREPQKVSSPRAGANLALEDGTCASDGVEAEGADLALDGGTCKVLELLEGADPAGED